MTFRRTNGRRLASLAGPAAVTVIAAVGSYGHMKAVALDAGQSPLLAALLPLSVDGMILVASLALGDGRRSRWSAWLAFLVGVAASLAANVMAAEPHAVSRAVSAWPAVALLLTVEVLARSGRAPATTTATPAPTMATAEEAAPVLVPVPSTTPTPARTTSARPRRTATATPATAEEVAGEIGRAPRTARRYLSASRARMAATGPAVAAA